VRVAAHGAPYPNLVLSHIGNPPGVTVTLAKSFSFNAVAGFNLKRPEIKTRLFEARMISSYPFRSDGAK
jgi:hypothetical protein